MPARGTLRAWSRLALLALSLVCAVPRAQAVSLGDELILSLLGDPVEVEIEVLQWEDMDLERVQISAATREEYEVFDLTWLPVLEDLDFNLVGPDLNGKVRVLISSRTPLDEPFLELLLVLRWPGGSLRREYVLLFDPPGRSLSATTAPVTAPVVTEPAPVAIAPQLPAAPEPAPVSAPEPVATAPEPVTPAPAPEPVTPPPAPVPLAEAVVEEPVTAAEDAGEIPDARTQLAIEVETLAPQPAAAPLDTSRRTYQVRGGDSLWNIARQFRPAGAGDNLYQMLLALHNLNRSSFVNNNISLLKANALLQLPTAADIAAIDPLTAEAEFDRRWEQGTERFAAVQRGEAIPLFAPPPEDVVLEVEEELPPGTEAPPVAADDASLIMVAETNVPQPLQLTDALETAPDAPAAIAPEPLVAEPPAPAVASVPAPDAAGAPALDQQVTQSTIRVVSREAFAAELEAELAAMRSRREAAEALAAQLQASLEQAQAERASEGSLFGRENLLLAGISAALLGALLAAGVFTLKVAGDLRVARRNTGSALDTRAQPGWLSSGAKSATERREPHMPEVRPAEPPTDSRKTAAAAAPARAAETEDLFARMEDLLGSGAEPSKNR